MKRNKVCVFLAVAAMAVSMFCVTKAQSAQKVIKIGYMTDLTSFLAENGIQGKQGAILAMEQAGYKVAGRPVKLIIEDTASSSAKALSMARKLVETDKVCIVIGPFNGGCAAAMTGYAARARIPNIENWPTVPNEVMLHAPWTWAPFGTHQSLTYTSGVYAAEVMHYKTASTLAGDFVAGRAFIQGFVDGFTKHGGKVVQQQWFPLNTKDLAPYLLHVKKADVLVPWLPGLAFNLQGFREFKSLKLKMAIDFPQGEFQNPVWLKHLGDLALGMMDADLYIRTIDTPMNKKFVAAFEKRWGSEPSTFAVGGYLSVKVALDALRRTHGNTSREAIAKALDKTNMKSFLGPIKFEGNTRIATGHYVIIKIVKVDNKLTPKIMKKYTIRTTKVGNKLVQSVAR